MRSWLLFTVLIRIPMFIAIDRFLIHDTLTAVTCCAALTLSHLMMTDDTARRQRNERIRTE